MEIVGKITNNKVFAYKYFYQNILRNFDNFMAIFTRSDKKAMIDYIDILYKKMIELDQTDKINKKEDLKVTAEFVYKVPYKVLLVYVMDTMVPYDVSNIGIVLNTDNNELTYFVRLNKSVFVDGEFGNALYIRNDFCRLMGYIDILSDDNLSSEFIKYTRMISQESNPIAGAARDFLDKNLNIDIENIKNVSKKNLENLKQFTKENFGKRKTREEVEKELNSIESINQTMNQMMNSMSQDFNLDLKDVNINFSKEIDRELSELEKDMNKMRSVRYYDENGDSSNKKINYINKVEYSKPKQQPNKNKSNQMSQNDLDTIKKEKQVAEELKLTEEEKVVSKIIHNNKWIKEYKDSFVIFDMCDTSHDVEMGIFNKLLKSKLENFDNNEFDKNISIVNCKRCKCTTCPINSYFSTLNEYSTFDERAKFLGSEFYKSKENTKEELKSVIDKLKKFDKLSLYTAEFILKTYLIKSLKVKKEKGEDGKIDKSIYEIEYVDLEKFALDTPKVSLVKNIIDINLNDESIADYIVKEEIDFDKIAEFDVKEYSNIVKQNPYHIAAYIKYLSEKENVILYNIFEELKQDKYIEAAKDDLNARNFEMRVDGLFLDEKSKKEVKNMIAYAKKYSESKSLDYISFNLRLYTENSELIQKLANLLKDAFVYYGYLKQEKVLSQSFYNIDSPDALSELYSDANLAVLVLKDVYSLESIDKNLRERIVNRLEEEINKNQEVILTIVVDSDKLRIDNAFTSSNVLREKVFDFELNEDSITEQDIYVKLINRLEKNFEVTDEFKVELLEYINSTYNKSNVSFKEYSDGLYEKIIFNSNKDKIDAKDLPEYDKNKSNEEIFEELNELVGLENVKEALVDLANLIEFKSKTEGELKLKSTNLHMVFLGNPGTGKTTVARMIAGILYNLKYIKYNKFVEVSSKDLVAKYVGQTAPKTMEVVEKAMGGVLFIDEAYSLATGNGGEGSFNDECIATLIQAMENYRDNLVVIFAGYKKEMQDFLDSNSGIVSRIGYTLDFKDYTVDQLMLIFKQMVNKAGFKIEDDAIEKAKEIVIEYKGSENFGNARFVRTLYEKVLIRHAKNMKNEENLEKLRTIYKDDISAENILKM